MTFEFGDDGDLIAIPESIMRSQKSETDVALKETQEGEILTLETTYTPKEVALAKLTALELSNEAELAISDAETVKRANANWETLTNDKQIFLLRTARKTEELFKQY